ncbi:hypothetical protein [Microbacterium sp. SORGH_AS_0862]|uniref:hypothetical protein n=1 Tax=Microbacterium sp. SORGH_AS_0862 TaxID=3041789 RepID=UPI0027926745|nr:hypothetical protein [Microbacterium sp. SORGH_AS_0862]MDQ1206938.1 hypothetical protein [Microbacterium sp. SORGH_AS_0862]
MSSDPTPATRRVEFDLRKPRFALYSVRPTVVIGGRGQPAQWGRGTWQVSATEPERIGVFLFNRVWRFGTAVIDLEPGAQVPLVYRAPLFPFGRGRLSAAATPLP